MTTLIQLSQTWVPIDTTAADVLVTPATQAALLIELFMDGKNAPTANSVGHMLKQPFIIPKGVGASIRGFGGVHISAFANA